MGTATERVFTTVVLLTVQFVHCSAQGGCSPPAGILTTGDGKLSNNVPTILTSGGSSTYLRPKIGGQLTDWYAVFSETQVRDHGLWCQVLPFQNPTDVADIGDWYYPPGNTPDGFTLVPTTSSSSVPYQSLKCTHQIGLLRINSIANNQGIVKCNTTLSNPPRTTNYFLVYSDDVYNNYSGPTVDPTMKLFLQTPKEAVSNLGFTLSFTVSNGVPSRLRCVDGNNNNLFSEIGSRGPSVSQLSREVIRSHYINSSYPDMTRVSIARTGQPRAAATYTCTVYVEGRINPQDDATYNFRQMGNAATTASITVAGTPTSVMATRTGFSSVGVSWTAPTPAPAIYEVFYQVTGMSSTSGGTTSNTELTLTGLALGSYSIFIVGSGADGDLVLPSAHSNTATVTIDIPQLSSVPTLAPSSTSIMVSWIPTQFTPSSYRVGYSCQLICGSSSVQQTDSVSGSLTEHTITSITPGSTCSVSVTAVFGSSIMSNMVTSSTNTTSAAPTGAPGGLASTSVESRSLSVAWGTVPCPHQRGPITGYRLRYSNGTSIVNTTGEESRQHVLTGLAPFTSYSVQVAAVNDGSAGPYSTPLTVETLQAVPGSVSNLSVVPGVVEVNISWNPPSEPNGIIVIYELGFSINGTILNNTNTSDTQYTLRDLPPSLSIIIVVRAYSVIGPGDFSNIVTSTMDVPIISLLSVEPVNSTAVRVTWTPLNLPVVDHYTVHYSSIVNGGSGRRRRQSNSGSVTFPASVSSGVVSGLLGGQQYQFSVSVTLSVGGVLYMSVPGPSVNAVTEPGVYPTVLKGESSVTTNFFMFTTYLPSPSSSYLSLCSLCPFIPSSPPSSQSQSVLGYSTALGVVSVLLVISLVGHLTTVIVCVLVRKKRDSSADTRKVPESSFALYDVPTLSTKDELDDIETSPNKAYGTTHHQVTTPTDECPYEDVNMCTS